MSEGRSEGAAAGWLSELHPRRFFLETWRSIDRAARARREKELGEDTFDYRPLVALTSAAVLLTIMRYYGTKAGYDDFVYARIAESPGEGWEAWLEGPYADLRYRYWWSGFRVFGYLLAPMAIVRFGFGHRIRDYGLSTEGLASHLRVYVLGYAVVFVCVIVASFHPRFLETYPFYDHAGRSVRDLLLWELAYAAQFFSLEFFYRGFLVRSLERSMGSHAIFAMTVPYCMVHFGKPMGETLGAIFAGIFLGTLALRTRSIWSGFFLHVGVAVTMDLAALVQKSDFPTHW